MRTAKNQANRFSRLVKNHRWLRIGIPAALVVVWLIIGGVGGPTFGKLSSVLDTDQASFLPSSAQSTQVQVLQSKMQQSKDIPAIIVVESSDRIQMQDFAKYSALTQSLSEVKGLASSVQPGASAVIGPIPSQDGKAVQYIAPISDLKNIDTVVKDLQTAANRGIPNHTKAYVSGPAGLTADLVKAFSGIDGVLLYVALIVVFVILLLVYRSILLPILVLLTSVFALSGAILLVYTITKLGWIQINGQTQGILSILVIGATTDYALLLVSRYRESLDHIQSKYHAIVHAWKSSIEPIAASAATVVLALLCLLFSDLNSNRSLGPVAALGIVFAFLSALTFLPAMLTLFGRSAFWPRVPKFDPVLAKEHRTKKASRLWESVANLVAKKPKTTWMVTLAILLVAALGIFQLKADGVSLTDTIVSQSNAVDGQRILAKHYKSDDATPMVVVTTPKMLKPITAALSKTDGVARVSTVTDSSGRPSSDPSATPKIIEGKVIVNAILNVDSSSLDAENVVLAARKNLSKIDSKVLVGGTAAISLDSNQTAKRDMKVIIPIVLIVILIVLIALLRSVLAPVILIGSVAISYAATMGASAIVFNHLFHYLGSDAAVPLFGFIFLVALGVDYNIFLMTRVREESFTRGTKAGILRGLTKTGGVITSAGIVLAATFAALGVVPILFLHELAFIVAFGVLIDTVVVRSLLVPALSYNIGKTIWWPSKLWRNGKS